METKPLISITKYFERLEDPRILLKTDHKLIDIIVIAICAVICGADKWTQVVEFGKAQKTWLRQFLELPQGIPSHDTFGRVFAVLSAKKFQICFQEWIQSVFELTEGQVVAIDGKTLRRSFDKQSNKAALHLVHAWSTANGVLLGQTKTREKSNEITAIPELLEVLQLKGCIVTIDAMGCQKKIAEQIHDQKADYVLAVKDNQKELKEALENTFKTAREKNFETMVYSEHQTLEKEHGRVETRTCYVLPLMYLHHFKMKWKGLKSLILIVSERFYQGVTTLEQRYYISSLKPDASSIASAVRQHWGVENSLHWCLDVAFREDECRVRIGEAAENFSLLRKIALICLKKEPSLKGGIQTKRLKAGWDTDYLLKVLRA
jgi:predicted transposase YbfD/YdcC